MAAGPVGARQNGVGKRADIRCSAGRAGTGAGGRSRRNRHGWPRPEGTAGCCGRSSASPSYPASSNSSQTARSQKRPAGCPSGSISPRFRNSEGKMPRPAGIARIQRTARKRCLWSGWYGWLRFSAAQAFFGGGLVLLQAWQGFAAHYAGAYAFPKTATHFSGTCAVTLLAWRTQTDPATREGGSLARRSSRRPDPIKTWDKAFGHHSAPRLFRPCRTFRQNTKAPPPDRIDTLRDPSGGGRRFRIERVLGAGKMRAFGLIVCSCNMSFRRTELSQFAMKTI